MMSLVSPSGAPSASGSASEKAIIAAIEGLASRLDSLSNKLDTTTRSQESSMGMLNAKLDRILDIGVSTPSAEYANHVGRVQDIRRMSAAEAMAVEKSVKEQREAKRRENMLSKMAKEEVFGVTHKERELASKARKATFRLLRSGIVLPTGHFRQTWDMLFLFAIMYIVLLFPYRIAFVTNFSVGYAVVDFILDMFFIADSAGPAPRFPMRAPGRPHCVRATPSFPWVPHAQRRCDRASRRHAQSA